MPGAKSGKRPPEPSALDRVAGVGSGLLAALIWGGFPVVTRLGVTGQDLDALDVTFIRFFTAALVTLPYLLRTGFFCSPLFALPLMVTGVGFPYIWIVSAGLAAAPVQHFAAVTPAMVIVFSTLTVGILRRRLPHPLVLASIGVILIGVIFTAWSGFSDAPAGLARSYVLFLIGAFLWAVYTVTADALGLQAMRATALVSVWSIVSFVPIYFSLKGVSILDAAPRALAIQAVYQGLMLSVGALYFYSKAVRLLGVISGSTFVALVPGVATIYAAFLLQEQPGITVIAGLVLVSLGMGATMAASNRLP